MRKRKYWIYFLIILAVACVIGYQKTRDHSSLLRTIPQWELQELGKGTFHSDQLKGKVVIINFWASWCMPCREEIPDLMDIQAKYGNKGIQVIGISLDDPETDLKNVVAYTKSRKINYPILMGNAETVAKFGSFESIPMTFLIDPKGKVVHHFMGRVSKEALEELIEQQIGN